MALEASPSEQYNNEMFRRKHFIPRTDCGIGKISGLTFLQKKKSLVQILTKKLQKLATSRKRQNYKKSP